MRHSNMLLQVFVGLVAGAGLFLIRDAAAVPQLITVAVPTAAVGSPYRADIIVAGSDATTLNGMPAGLTVTKSAAGILTLSGTPQMAGDVNLTLNAKNVDGDLTANLRLIIKGDVSERPLVLAAGSMHACAMNPSGVWCWGANEFGQLGDGTTEKRDQPVKILSISPTSTDAKALALGPAHSCALLVQQVYCWGTNDEGQLGTGDNAPQKMPYRLPLQNVAALAAAGKHTCALVNGGVVCWGSNAFGQLGNGKKTGALSAISAISALQAGSGVTQITAGQKHTCALANGGVLCWGSNVSGQLGKLGIAESLIPIMVIPPNSGVTAIAAGANQSCAIQNTALLCWGDNRNGQLGLTAEIVAGPTQVPSGTSGITSVALGLAHVCAVKNGALACMGNASSGQIGYPNPAQSDTAQKGLVPPIQQIGSPSNLVAGDAFSCAITGLVVRCWGSNERGQLGDSGGVTTARFLLTLANDVSQIGAGGDHACAVIAGGVQCWGDNTDGQLGVAVSATANTNRFLPVTALPAGTGVTSVAAGNFHTCAVLRGGVQCWGNNEDGQLGNNARTSKAEPVQSIAASSGATAIALGGFHTCAIVAGGLKCWGFNDFGQLGDGTVTSKSVPIDVIPAGSGVTAVSAGAFHTCVIQASRPRCWGRNSDGQLGDGTTTNRLLPTNVQGISSAIAISAGGYHSCFASGANTFCTGYNFSGQLGDDTAISKPRPVQVLGLNQTVERLFSGLYHSCAILAGGGLMCWGENLNGQLGDGTQLSLLRARMVIPSGVAIESGAAGFAHTCITVANATLCTGASDSGQLGSLASPATHFSVLNFPAPPLTGLTISLSSNVAFVGQEVVFNVRGIPANARGTLSLIVSDVPTVGCPQLSLPVADIVQCRYTFQAEGTYQVGIALSPSDTQAAASAILPAKLTIEPVIKGSATALYRAYNPLLRAHFVTTDANEYTVLGQYGWNREGTIGRMFNKGSSILGVPTVPVYRLYNANLRRHLITTDGGERSILLVNNWLDEGLIGYISQTNIVHPTVKLAPLYRLYASALQAHLFTTDANEAEVLPKLGIWRNEGAIGYVLK